MEGHLQKRVKCLETRPYDRHHPGKLALVRGFLQLLTPSPPIEKLLVLESDYVQLLGLIFCAWLQTNLFSCGSEHCNIRLR